MSKSSLWDHYKTDILTGHSKEEPLEEEQKRESLWNMFKHDILPVHKEEETVTPETQAPTSRNIDDRAFPGRKQSGEHFENIWGDSIGQAARSLVGVPSTIIEGSVTAPWNLPALITNAATEHESVREKAKDMKELSQGIAHPDAEGSYTTGDLLSEKRAIPMLNPGVTDTVDDIFDYITGDKFVPRNEQEAQQQELVRNLASIFGGGATKFILQKASALVPAGFAGKIEKIMEKVPSIIKHQFNKPTMKEGTADVGSVLAGEYMNDRENPSYTNALASVGTGLATSAGIKKGLNVVTDKAFKNLRVDPDAVKAFEAQGLPYDLAQVVEGNNVPARIVKNTTQNVVENPFTGGDLEKMRQGQVDAINKSLKVDDFNTKDPVPAAKALSEAYDATKKEISEEFSRRHKEIFEDGIPTDTHHNYPKNKGKKTPKNNPLKIDKMSEEDFQYALSQIFDDEKPNFPKNKGKKSPNSLDVERKEYKIKRENASTGKLEDMTIEHDLDPKLHERGLTHPFRTLETLTEHSGRHGVPKIYDGFLNSLIEKKGVASVKELRDLYMYVNDTAFDNAGRAKFNPDVVHKVRTAIDADLKDVLGKISPDKPGQYDKFKSDYSEFRKGIPKDLVDDPFTMASHKSPNALFDFIVTETKGNNRILNHIMDKITPKDARIISEQVIGQMGFNNTAKGFVLAKFTRDFNDMNKESKATLQRLINKGKKLGQPDVDLDKLTDVVSYMQKAVEGRNSSGTGMTNYQNQLKHDISQAVVNAGSGKTPVTEKKWKTLAARALMILVEKNMAKNVLMNPGFIKYLEEGKNVNTPFKMSQFLKKGTQKRYLNPTTTAMFQELLKREHHDKDED